MVRFLGIFTACTLLSINTFAAQSMQLETPIAIPAIDQTPKSIDLDKVLKLNQPSFQTAQENNLFGTKQPQLQFAQTCAVYCEDIGASFPFCYVDPDDPFCWQFDDSFRWF